jgi:hypothetical protein
MRIHMMIHSGKIMQKWTPELLRRMSGEKSDQCSFPNCNGLRVPYSEWNACACHQYLICCSLSRARRRRKDVLGEDVDVVKILPERMAPYEPIVQFLEKKQGEL